MKNILIALVVIVLIAGGAFFVLRTQTGLPGEGNIAPAKPLTEKEKIAILDSLATTTPATTTPAQAKAKQKELDSLLAPKSTSTSTTTKEMSDEERIRALDSLKAK